MAEIRVGEPAPDFTLPDQDGKMVALAYLRGGPVVLYFYPKDFTSGCTQEACHFRDSYEDFTEVGAKVVGVSGDSAASHRGFIEKYLLPFTLLSDSDGSVRQLYGIKGRIFPDRVTFVIDKDGVVRDIFSSKTDMKAHVTRALEIIKSIR